MAILRVDHPSASPFRVAERERSVESKTGGSRQRYQRACRSLAGGVSSGLRRLARPYPLYFAEGCGSRLIDVDGSSYLDYTLAWGRPGDPGHAPPEMASAIARQAERGLTFGAQHDLEIEVAELLTASIPCADSVGFANSGTEIVQVALRLARAATGRKKFLKFEGHYHGWDDSVLVSYHPTPDQIAAAQGRLQSPTTLRDGLMLHVPNSRTHPCPTRHQSNSRQQGRRPTRSKVMSRRSGLFGRR